MNTATLEPIDAVAPSTYNPRAADPRRLDLIQLSFRKLGFLSPVFADANGEILSGHQRHLVATRMGLPRIPVQRTHALPPAAAKPSTSSSTAPLTISTSPATPAKSPGSSRPSTSTN